MKLAKRNVQSAVRSSMLAGLILAFPFSPTPIGPALARGHSQVAFSQITVVPNIETAGIAVSGLNLPKSAQLLYLRAGDTTWRAGHRLTRIDDGRLVGSLFGLTPSTTYQVRVADGTTEISGSFTTQPDELPFTPLTTLYVSANALPGGDGSTGGVLSPTDHPEFTQFSPEELDVIVREAEYRRGVKVMAHAQGAEGIKNAVRAGIHSIEHGIYLDDEAIELMLKHGTFLVPTLLAPLAVLEAGEKGGMPDYGIRKSKEVIEIHSESISRAHKAGVKIAMGTDAGVMPHGTNLRELGLMVNIGMTPMEAIVATTKIAAECLGWQDNVGTLEAGKLADVVIVKTNPLQDIRSLEKDDNIVFVMKDGKRVKELKG